MNTVVLNTTSQAKTRPQLHSLPIDTNGPDLPVNVLIDPNSCSLRPLTATQLLFCYQALLNTIDSCLDKRYSDFDGHTTANCCHGMSLLSWHLIQDVLELDLHALKQTYEKMVYQLEQHIDNKAPQNHEGFAPKALVNLTGLYILCLTKELNPVRGIFVVSRKLQTLSPLSSKACDRISHALQKFFANWIATSYESYLRNLDGDLHINGAPLKLWGKYVQAHFIRCDKRGLRYASNLFSMQVFLAHLSQTKAKVALVNDIWKPSSNQVVDRYTQLFEGDGYGGFRPIPFEEKNLDNDQEPIIVLGGCAYSENLDKKTFSKEIRLWSHRISQLVLACDVYYPQFQSITDDPTFNHTPIIPKEIQLSTILEAHSTTKGVSSQDPTLYCLSHLCTISAHQFLSLESRSHSPLPFSFIPQSPRSSSPCLPKTAFAEQKK